MTFWRKAGPSSFPLAFDWRQRWPDYARHEGNSRRARKGTGSLTGDWRQILSEDCALELAGGIVELLTVFVLPDVEAKKLP